MKFSLIAVFGLAICLMALTGCETTVDTNGENFARVAHAADTNGKMFPMDVESTLMLDRANLLSNQPVPIH